MKKLNSYETHSQNFLNRHLPGSVFFIVYTALFIFSFLYIFICRGDLIVSDFFRLWTSLAYGYWIAISFILAQIGLGGITLRLPLLRNLELSGIPFLLFSFGIGCYITNCILTLFAIFKWMGGWGLYLYLSLSLPFLVIGFLTIHKTLPGFNNFQESKSDNKLKKRWPVWLVAFLLIIWIFPYFVQTLLPNSDWDGAWHHLPIAKRFLTDGILWVSPDFKQYNFPGAIHLVYSLFFAASAESAIIPFNFLVSLGIILSVYFFSYHLWSKKIAIWSVVICASTNIIWEVALTPRIDGFLTFFFLLAVFSFLLWIKNTKNQSLLFVTGMMLGMSAGIKYTAVFFIAAISISGFLFLWNDRQKKIRHFLPITLIILFLLIPTGFWYMRNAAKLGDPLYPYIKGMVFLNDSGNKQEFDTAVHKLLEKMPSKNEIKNIFNQAGLQPFSDFKDYTQQDNRKTFLNGFDLKLFNFWDIIVNPDRYQRKPYHEITPFLVLFFVFPFFYRDRISLFLYLIAFFVFISIAANSHILRYALPVFPLFSVGSAFVVSRIRTRWLFILAVLLSISILFRFSFLECKKLINLRPYHYLSANLERLDWLTEVGYNTNTRTPLFIKFLNQQIDKGVINKNDTLFMIGEGKGNLLQCEYLPDSSICMYPWLIELLKFGNDYPKILQDLKVRDIGYIVINFDYLFWAFNEYPLAQKEIVFGLYHLVLFLDKYTEIIYYENGIALAEIKQHSTE